MKDAIFGVIGTVWGIAYIVFLFAYAMLAMWGWAEIINIDNWGWPLILNGLVMGLFLPLIIMFPLLSSVGIYFGAVDVMGWEWWIGLLLAFPGVLYTVLGVMGVGVMAIINKLRGAE